jgi:putative transposase
LIWRINELNGKETPQGCLLKHTAHQFKKILVSQNSQKLEEFKVAAANKQYEFCKETRCNRIIQQGSSLSEV